MRILWLAFGLGSFSILGKAQEERKWTRSERQHTPIEEKESFGWIKTAPSGAEYIN